MQEGEELCKGMMMVVEGGGGRQWNVTILPKIISRHFCRLHFFPTDFQTKLKKEFFSCPKYTHSTLRPKKMHLIPNMYHSLLKCWFGLRSNCFTKDGTKMATALVSPWWQTRDIHFPRQTITLTPTPQC